MGTIRTMLALFVVLGHILIVDSAARPYLGGGAVLAVNLFFVMSGFYMALVLDRKYQHATVAFYRARALRLYPLYILTLLATLAVNQWIFPESMLARSVGPNIERLWSDDAQWLAPFVIFSNLTLFGLDFAQLVCEPAGAMALTFIGEQNCNALSGFTVVPQAWSLGSEALFYAIIPWIFRRGWPMIAAALCLALVAKITVLSLGLFQTPWDRMFFPAVLAYFLSGVAAYLVYNKLRLTDLDRYRSKIIGGVAAVLVSYVLYLPVTAIAATLWYAKTGEVLFTLQDAADSLIYIEPVVTLLFVLVLPLLFHCSKTSRWDNEIGEFSYPIYITHMLALAISSMLLADHLTIEHRYLRTLFHLAVVMVIASLAVWLVTKPMERIRHPEIARTKNSARLGQALRADEPSARAESSR